MASLLRRRLYSSWDSKLNLALKDQLWLVGLLCYTYYMMGEGGRHILQRHLDQWSSVRYVPVAHKLFTGCWMSE
jgi:hypothetical protein